MMTSPTARLLDHLPRSRLAEGPFWDAETQQLLWVDIAGHAIHRYDPESGCGGTRAVSDAIGFAIPSRDGRLVAGIGGAVVDLAFDIPAEARLAAPAMHAENRFNDGKCDPRGRLWAGTMHRNAGRDRAPTGALYRWLRGTLDVVEAPISLSNGLGWSPTGDTLYYADTHAGTVWAYDYDLASGTAANRRVFAPVPIEDGVPDGLAIDAGGRVFVAIWRGARITVFAPSGRLEASLPIPVRSPTSCCFGGPDLQTLFVTTMPSSNENDPRSGFVFALRMDAPGCAGARFDRSL